MATVRQFISGSLIPLSCIFEDQLGNLIDVDGAVITIIGPGNQLLKVNQTMNRDSQGTYSYMWQTPVNLPVGQYQEIYEGFFRGHVRKVKGQFEILAPDAFNRPPTPTTRTGKALELLRDALADNIPNITRKQWSDEELLNFLQLAMMDINMFPTLTNFNLENFPDGWMGLLIEGAVALSLRAIILEMAMHDIDFNDNGLSVSISRRLDNYMALYNDAAARFQENAKLVKKQIRPFGVNIISGMVAFNSRSLRMSQLLSIVNQR